MGRVSGSAVALPPGLEHLVQHVPVHDSIIRPRLEQRECESRERLVHWHDERAGGHALATRRPATVHRALAVTLEWTLGDARLADDEALHVDLDISCERRGPDAVGSQQIDDPPKRPAGRDRPPERAPSGWARRCRIRACARPAARHSAAASPCRSADGGRESRPRAGCPRHPRNAPPAPRAPASSR